MKDFKSLAAELDPEISLSGPRSFELLLGEGRIACRVMQSPDARWILSDFYLSDVSDLTTDARQALERTALALNGIAPFAADYSLGIDTRGFLVLTGRRKFDGLTGKALGAAIGNWLDIGTDVVKLASAASGRLRGVTVVGAPTAASIAQGDSA